jgi:hypothetical protein
MNKQNFTHILQQRGVLRNFTIAKVVPTLKLEKIKEAAMKKATSEAEFNRIMDAEMKKMGNMHNQANPIPGIIYERDDKGNRIESLAKDQIKLLKSKNFTKTELCSYIMFVIHSLGLNKEDFENTDQEERLQDS